MNSDEFNTTYLQWDINSEHFNINNNEDYMFLTQINSPTSMDSGFNTDSNSNIVQSPSYVASPPVENYSNNYNDEFNNIPNYQISNSYQDAYSSPVTSVSAPQQQQQQQHQQHANEWFSYDQSTNIEKAYLEIKEEPNETFRFRYATEQGPHGTIKAPQGIIKSGSSNVRKDKGYPTVVLHNFNSTSEVVIRCCLYQKSEDSENITERCLHPHKLIMKPRNAENYDPHYFKISQQNNYTAIFQGLGVIQTKKDEMADILFNKIKCEKEYEENRILSSDEKKVLREEVKSSAKKKIEINQIVLGFTAFMRDELSNQWIKIADTVYSNTINNEKSVNGKLMIARMSTCQSEAQGGQEIYMFVNKVDKNTIQVRFYETDDGDSDGNVIWEANGIFTPSDVHHQYGIVLKTPPYRDQFIANEVQVFVQLYRKNSPNKSKSEPFKFFYKPNIIKRKNPRALNAPIPTVVASFQPSKSSPSSSNISSPRDTNNQQYNINFGCSTSQHHEVGEMDDIVNLIISIRPTVEGYHSPSSNISEITSYLIGNDNNTLEIDAVAPENHQLGLLEKLKLIEKFCAGKCNNEKMREMMLMAIDASDEIAFTDLIQNGSPYDIQEILHLILKYKLNDILQFKNEWYQNALHLCVLNDYYQILKVFIKLGVGINEADEVGQTPLHLAVQENSLECFKLLLKTPNISINERNDRGHTPLSLSVSNNNLSMTKMLVDAGAIPSMENLTNGFNCLHAAVNVQQVSLEMIKYLIEIDRNMLFVKSKSGKDVRQMAKANNVSLNILDYLSSFYDQDFLLDEKCMKKLCEIFDRNENWKMFVTLMDIEGKIDEWEKLDSPSQALFSYLKNSKKSIDDLVGLLDVLSNDADRMSAMNAIDEMIARKYDQ